MPAPTRPFRILTMCTGNVCRSPYAQLVLARELEAVTPGGFVVTSVGTHGLVGQGVDPGSAALLDAAGVDHGEFTARRASASLLEEADLILGMAREHVTWVADEAPRSALGAFTLLQLARLVSALGSDEPWSSRLAHLDPDDVVARWTLVRQTAAASRHRRLVRSLRRNDIPDPYRQGPEQFAAMGRQIDEAVAALLEVEHAVRH